VLVNADIYDRKFEAAQKRLIKRSEDFDTMDWYIPNDLWLAEVYGYMGKEDLKKQYYQSAAAILEKKLEEDPDNPRIHRVHSSLGKAYAGLGREQEAIGEGILGVECLPVEKDAIGGPLRLEDLARIYVMLGKYEDAIDILEQLLSMHSELSVAMLRRHPIWDPLRDHPHFQKLLKSNK
jgi:tetratricopeptide (TPR) repeat protein